MKLRNIFFFTFLWSEMLLYDQIYEKNIKWLLPEISHV